METISTGLIGITSKKRFWRANPPLSRMRISSKAVLVIACISNVQIHANLAARLLAQRLPITKSGCGAFKNHAGPILRENMQITYDNSRCCAHNREAHPAISRRKTASSRKGYRERDQWRWSGNGAAEGTRTPDPNITNVVLYQLSYCGVPGNRPRQGRRLPGARLSCKRGLLDTMAAMMPCRDPVPFPLVPIFRACRKRSCRPKCSARLSAGG